MIGSIGPKLLHFDLERGTEIRSTALEQTVVGIAPTDKHAQATDEPTSLVATKHGLQLVDPRTRDGLAIDVRPLLYRGKAPPLFVGIDSADRASFATVDTAGAVRQYAKVRPSRGRRLTRSAWQSARGSLPARAQGLRRPASPVAASLR